MICDVCRKRAQSPPLVLRWRNHWPDRAITQVLLLHNACDTHPWPADGYGHIDVRALDGRFCAELCDRAVTKTGDSDQRAAAKIQEAFMAWGHIGEPAAAEWCDLHAGEEGMRPLPGCRCNVCSAALLAQQSETTTESCFEEAPLP